MKHQQQMCQISIRAQCLVALALLALCVVWLSSSTCEAFKPYEIVWLRIRSDPKLKSLFDWSELVAEKRDTMAEALANMGLKSDGTRAAGDTQLHLYRLVEIDLNASVGELGLKHGDKLYLTSNDLIN